MISAWHLLWICPLCVIVGVLMLALLSANDMARSDEDDDES